MTVVNQGDKYYDKANRVCRNQWWLKCGKILLEKHKLKHNLVSKREKQIVSEVQGSTINKPRAEDILCWSYGLGL